MDLLYLALASAGGAFIGTFFGRLRFHMRHIALESRQRDELKESAHIHRYDTHRAKDGPRYRCGICGELRPEELSG